MALFSLKHLSFRIIIVISVVSIGLSLLVHAQHIQSALTIQEALAKLEASAGGRIGIDVIHTTHNQHIQYRAEERFPLQSTAKVMVVSAILKQSMTEPNLLKQKIHYAKKDMVLGSPITEKHRAKGMTIAELCAAALMYSDNTSTNLLVKKLGGLQAVNTFARTLGDDTFRIDAKEPELNSNPADLHDTSTPAAMGKSLQQLALGNALAFPQRKQFVSWMKASTTGKARIRAGLPAGWEVADKTGSSSDYGITNDIGIIWPSNGAPIVVSVYFYANEKDVAYRDDIIAAVMRLLMNELKATK